MFWGWGRILGSILGGPLGTLGRPPGACKAKSVSRVCFNSVDAAHEEDNEKGKHVPECHQAAVQQPANLGGQWIRSFHLGTAFLNAGYDLMRSHHQPVSPDRSQGLTVIELFQADKNNSDLEVIKQEDVLPPSPNLLQLLLRFSRASIVQFSDDGENKLKPVIEQSKQAGVKEKSQSSDVSKVESQNEFVTSSSQLQTTVFDKTKLESKNVDEDDSVEQSKNIFEEKMKIIEEDLVQTRKKMDIALTGMRGLDLLLDGDFEEGFELVTFAAKNGDPESLYNLGVIYERGHGRKRNLRKAMKFYQAAAELNHPASCYNLAVIYENEVDGPNSDPVRAQTLLKKAAVLGLPEARQIFDEAEFSAIESKSCKMCHDNGWTDYEPGKLQQVDLSPESSRDYVTLARAYQFGMSGMPVDKSLALELFRMASHSSEEARKSYLALSAELQSESASRKPEAKICLTRNSFSSPELRRFISLDSSSLESQSDEGERQHIWTRSLTQIN